MQDFAEDELSDLSDDVHDAFLEGIGYASARKDCETYIECNTRCLVDVAIGEAKTQVIGRSLTAAAEALAEKQAAKLIVGAGTISTTISVGLAVSCSWKCVEAE